MRSLNQLLFSVLALVSLWACGDSNGPKELPVCNGPVQLRVFVSTKPSFQWTPACRVNQLDIMVKNGGPIWGVTFVVDSNLLQSPVQFGVAPYGAVGLPMAPNPLPAGVTYTASLFVDPVGAQGLVKVGSKDFTP